MKMKKAISISKHSKLIIFLFVLILFALALPFEELFFHPTITGEVIAKTFVSGTEFNKTCNISLNQGWNLISTTCLKTNHSIESTFLSIENNYTSIHAYDLLDTNDPWKSYNPNLPSLVVQDLVNISREKGYWINMDNNSLLVINGTFSWPGYIPLNTGWNLVGYISSEENKDIKDAISNINSSLTMVWAYNSSSSSFIYYNPALDTGTLSSAILHYGYWINMTSDAIWFTT
jgi:hypothetical protein